MNTNEKISTKNLIDANWIVIVSGSNVFFFLLVLLFLFFFLFLLFLLGFLKPEKIAIIFEIVMEYLHR
jgi:hypothetical protein